MALHLSSSKTALQSLRDGFHQSTNPGTCACRADSQRQPPALSMLTVEVLLEREGPGEFGQGTKCRLETALNRQLGAFLPKHADPDHSLFHINHHSKES